jgi:AraC-like DNA-binding protein/mannose-6-phosphate isomerase-like protein (cupin superfamily)
MSRTAALPFALEEVHLTGAFYVDQLYAQKHAHALHAHRDKLELLYVCGGEGQYRIGSREYMVREGDLLICNANTLHGETLTLENTIQTYCCALTGVRLPKLPENSLLAAERRPVVTLMRYKELVHQTMPKIYELFLEQKNGAALAEQMAKTVLLMTMQELQEQETVSKSQAKQRTETLIRSITAYLDRHYTEPLRMEEICDALHISESHLSHTFKKETGLSPKQYIILRRIGEAQSLLEVSDVPIHEIEEQLGFGSSCHLTATFKKYVGISPREYRKHYRQGAE